MFFKRYKNLRQFKPYFKKYMSIIIPFMFVCLFGSSLTIVLGWQMGEQIIGITNGITSQIVKATVLIFVALCAHHIFWFFWEFGHGAISNKVAKDLRKDFAEKTLNVKYSNLKENSSGYFLERLNDDITAVSRFYTGVIGTLVDFAVALGFFIFIFVLSWQIGLLFVIGIAVLFALEIIKVKVDVNNLKKVKTLTEQNNSKFNEAISGIKDIKGFGIKAAVLQRNNIVNEMLTKQDNHKLKVVTFISRLCTGTRWLLDCLIILLSAFWLLPSGQISVVILLVIFNYKSQMYDCVGFFASMSNQYTQGEFQAKRILEILNHSEMEIFGKENIILKTNDIEVKNLSFGYDKKFILENVNFKAASNTCSVFVGASGSGKTTLFGLLSKLLEIQNDKIFFGGYDINRFSEKCFRSAICIVNQEPFIFNDSVLNNIKIVRPNATKTEIENACIKANVHNEILAMQNGYDTMLAENGSNLSGGQKQRIAIARAILKDTPIILFDEPTSALDKENQTLFFEVLKELKQTKTILVIAHKLNSYDVFDNIFTLKNGKIE